MEAEEAQENHWLFQFCRERKHILFCHGLTLVRETGREEGNVLLCVRDRGLMCSEVRKKEELNEKCMFSLIKT